MAGGRELRSGDHSHGKGYHLRHDEEIVFREGRGTAMASGLPPSVTCSARMGSAMPSTRVVGSTADVSTSPSRQFALETGRLLPAHLDARQTGDVAHRGLINLHALPFAEKRKLAGRAGPASRGIHNAASHLTQLRETVLRASLPLLVTGGAALQVTRAERGRRGELSEMRRLRTSLNAMSGNGADPANAAAIS